ncbi:MAG TPA: aminotransferase class V-fold PLP-dependent enzyme [Phycisphaerae bacterium]|jgi:selenocysteine lyase/cysteine desulfurase
MSLPPLPDNITPSLFPSLAKWAFFNHSGVSPMPKPAADAMRRYIEQSENDAYITGHWYKHAETTRRHAAKLINADAKEIAFVKNTSEGLAFVANGLDWHAGDEIISTRSEYPANVYPWMAAAQRHGVKHIMIQERPDGRILPEDLFAAITPKTRMIAISHVEYGSGFRADLATIGAFCRQNNILFCVDAIQSIGVLPVDVQAMHIDYLSAGGHKWMLGPEGLGIFFCRRGLLDTLKPEVGWMNVINATDYEHFDFTLRPDARRFECGGYNIAGVLALGASLEMLLNIGIHAIWSRVHALTTLLVEGLYAKGYTVYSSRNTESECSGIVSFIARNPTDHPPIIKTLEDKHIIIVEREKRLRAAPHFYQSETQINALLNALPTQN